MRLQEPICPACGGPSPEGTICGRCRAGNLDWARCDHRVALVHCPSCGALKQQGSWSDRVPERDQLIREAVHSAVHLHPDVQHPQFFIETRETGATRTVARVKIRGELYGGSVEKVCEVTVAWRNEQCDRCSRISGSYYEGIVQVRAEGRKPSLHEVRRAATIALEIEESLQSTGNRLSFLSQVDETKDGLDITVGSQAIGQAIADMVTKELGGRCTTHPKLVGERSGRPLYRITYAIRLPRVVYGDVIEVDGHYGLATQVGPRVVRYIDLASGQSRTIRPDRIGRIVANSRDAVNAVVAFVEGTTIGLLDPDTGVTKECAAPLCRNVKPGSMVRAVREGDLLIPVGVI